MGKREPNDLDRLVARRIMQVRMRCRMSRAQLGRALGVSFQQVQKYERGESRVTIGRLGDIAAALGVPLGTLLTEDASERAGP